MTQAGSLAPSRTTPSRVSRRRRTTRPLSSRPATLQLFLPRSIPRTVIVIVPLLSSTVTVSVAPTKQEGGPSHKILTPAARRGGRSPSDRVRDEQAAGVQHHQGGPQDG